MCSYESTQRSVEHLSLAQSSKYGGYRAGLFSGELRGLGKVGLCNGFFVLASQRTPIDLQPADTYVCVWCVCVSVCVSVLEDLSQQMLKQGAGTASLSCLMKWLLTDLRLSLLHSHPAFNIY